MSKIFLDIDQSQIDDITKNFEGSKAVLNAASKNAIQKTVNWIKDTAIVEIEERAKVPADILKARTLTYVEGNADNVQGKVWFGSYRINFIRMGAQQTPTGVQVGDLIIEHAFIAKINKNQTQEGVYIRKGKARFPVLTQKKVIADVATNVFQNDILERVNNKLIENLKAELKWEIDKSS